MHTSRPAKASTARFDPERLTPRVLARMAWNPSYRAPSIHEVQNAPFTPPGPPRLGHAESRLRAAVLAAPDDDAPRLAYAAFCEALHDERGGFIRLQIALARARYAGNALRPDLVQEESDLLARHGDRWRAELEPWAAREVVFRRGFAESLSLAGRSFISLGEGLFRTAPIRGVRLVAVQPLIGELARCPHLGQLRRLDLTGNQIGPSGVTELGRSASRVGLQGLDLSGNALGASGVQELATWPERDAIRELGLRANALTAESLDSLLRAYPRLESLALSDNELGPEGLANAGGTRELRRLAVAGCGLTTLATARIESLESLDLARNDLGPAGARALVSDGVLPQLAELDLSFNSIESAGLEALAVAGAFPNLRRLNIRANRLSTEGVLALSRAPHWRALERLDLSANPIGDTGALAVFQAKPFPGITHLSLANCGLHDAGLERIASTGGLAGLQELSLAWNPCGDAGILALARCAETASLRGLDLTGTPIGLAAAIALAESPHLISLRTLKFGQNPRLPVDVAAMLRTRFS